jgi:hypothetical protein
MHPWGTFVTWDPPPPHTPPPPPPTHLLECLGPLAEEQRPRHLRQWGQHAAQGGAADHHQAALLTAPAQRLVLALAAKHIPGGGKKQGGVERWVRRDELAQGTQRTAAGEGWGELRVSHLGAMKLATVRWLHACRYGCAHDMMEEHLLALVLWRTCRHAAHTHSLTAGNSTLTHTGSEGQQPLLTGSPLAASRLLLCPERCR